MYPFIDDETAVKDIFGKVGNFSDAKHVNHVSAGCLPYGVARYRAPKFDGIPPALMADIEKVQRATIEAEIAAPSYVMKRLDGYINTDK